MQFRIEAHLLQGEPRLRIFDADSGALRLHWRYRTALIDACHGRGICGEDQFCAARANLHALMRELFLLSCAGNASSFSLDGAADACRHCDRCTTAPAPVPLAARLSRFEAK